MSLIGPSGQEQRAIHTAKKVKVYSSCTGGRADEARNPTPIGGNCALLTPSGALSVTTQVGVNLRFLPR